MDKSLFDNLFELLEKTTLKKRCTKNNNNRRGFVGHRGALYGKVKPSTQQAQSFQKIVVITLRFTVKYSD